MWNNDWWKRNGDNVNISSRCPVWGLSPPIRAFFSTDVRPQSAYPTFHHNSVLIAYVLFTSLQHLCASVGLITRLEAEGQNSVWFSLGAEMFSVPPSERPRIRPSLHELYDSVLFPDTLCGGGVEGRGADRCAVIPTVKNSWSCNSTSIVSWLDAQRI